MRVKFSFLFQDIHDNISICIHSGFGEWGNDDGGGILNQNCRAHNFVSTQQFISCTYVSLVCFLIEHHFPLPEKGLFRWLFFQFSGFLKFWFLRYAPSSQPYIDDLNDFVLVLLTVGLLVKTVETTNVVGIEGDDDLIRLSLIAHIEKSLEPYILLPNSLPG